MYLGALRLLIHNAGAGPTLTLPLCHQAVSD